jgi:hypothetical protein
MFPDIDKHLKPRAIVLSQPNKSLDASGGSVFLNLLGAAKGALSRAAASTQPLCGFSLF